jgi:DNA-binding MarR family transcriptional regulator
MKLEEEINQSVFKDNFHKAHVNLLFTAAWLNQRINRLLKPYEVSAQQFNILRILKGLGNKPASLKLITSRMLDKASNTSRLVDKLIEKQMVVRTFCPMDRRQVEIRITPFGISIIQQCSQIIEEDFHSTMNNLTESQAFQLNDLLEIVRNGVLIDELTK